MKMSFRVDLFGPFFSTVDGWLRRGGRWAGQCVSDRCMG